MVSGVPEDTEMILAIAGFRPTEFSRNVWMRHLTLLVDITASIQIEGIHLKLNPSIGEHSPENHAANAVSAAIMLKTAMTLAERIDGSVTQGSLVGVCKKENGGNSQRLLGAYPEQPVLWENLCVGFREVLGGGIPQLGPADAA